MADRQMQPIPFEPSAATADDINGLLEALEEVHNSPSSGECFRVCKVCNEEGGHAPHCFVPVLKQWQDGGDGIPVVLSRWQLVLIAAGLEYYLACSGIQTREMNTARIAKRHGISQAGQSWMPEAIDAVLDIIRKGMA